MAGLTEMANSINRLKKALKLEKDHPEAFVTEAYRSATAALRDTFPHKSEVRGAKDLEDALKSELPTMLWHDLKRLRILRNDVYHSDLEPDEGDLEITRGTLKKLIHYLSPDERTGTKTEEQRIYTVERRDWKAFQDLAKTFFEKELQVSLYAERELTLPNKETHRFDFSSDDNSILVECKSYTWTKTGNEPAAKLNLAKTDAKLLLATSAERKILAFEDDLRPKDGKSLAELFERRNRKWLEDVEIWRYLDGKLECIGPESNM